MFGKKFANIKGTIPGGLAFGPSEVTVICNAQTFEGINHATHTYNGPEGPWAQTVEVPITWGKTSHIALNIAVFYNLFLKPAFYRAFPYAGRGRFTFQQKWAIYYDSGETLNLHALPLSSTVPEMEMEEVVVMADFASDSISEVARGPYVAGSSNLAGAIKSDGIQVGVSKGPLQVGKEVFAKNEAFNITTNALRLTAKLKVEGKPPPVKPPVVVNVPRELLRHTVHFDVREGQEFLSGDELRRLEDKWYDPLLRLAPQVHDAIKAGKCPIRLDGHTSTTGSVAFNLDLSLKRIESMAAKIQSLFNSTQIVFLRHPHGESQARVVGAAEQERYVTLSISESYAKLLAE